MSNRKTVETERLYTEGMALYRAARWEEAAEVFTQLKAMSAAYPEIDALLAHAQLKGEIARTAMPEGALPPAAPKVPIKPLAVAAAALVICVGILGALRLRQPAAPEPAAVVVQPTPIPTPRPRPSPIVKPLPGAVLVRMAEGETLTRVTSNIEIVLDASGSMQGIIDERRKIDIAHTALETLIGQLPEQTNVALRSYGHRRTQDCNDIELIKPLAPLDRASVIEAVKRINPVSRSLTPMALSLQQVAEDLKGAEGDALVVLVSDGDETCDGDPAAAAAALRAQNPNIRVSVIGFVVGPEEWRARLQAIAESGGGSYFDASDAAQLVDALQEAVALSYRVLDTKGAEVYSGPLGSTTPELLPGSYSIEIGGLLPLRIDQVTIDGALTTIELREQDGKLEAAMLRR